MMLKLYERKRQIASAIYQILATTILAHCGKSSLNDFAVLSLWGVF